MSSLIYLVAGQIINCDTSGTCLNWKPEDPEVPCQQGPSGGGQNQGSQAQNNGRYGQQLYDQYGQQPYDQYRQRPQDQYGQQPHDQYGQQLHDQYGQRPQGQSNGQR